MHVARQGADMLGNVGQKGDNVVLYFALNLLHPRDGEAGLLVIGFERLSGSGPQLDQAL